ncbi:AAA family ATPase [Ensifer canadensis]
MKDWVLAKCGEPDFAPSERTQSPVPVTPAKLIRQAEAPKRFYDGHLTRDGYRIAAEYDYVTTDGEILFQVVRYEHPDREKTFLQRRPDGKSGWFAGRPEPIIYRWPEIAARPDEPVFIVEGEKDVDTLFNAGVLATTAPNGSWPDELTPLKARTLFVIPDNDEKGAEKAEKFIELAQGIATVKRIELPGLPLKGDVTDWINAGHSIEDLVSLCTRAAPVPANDNQSLPVINPAEWQGLPVPAREWFIEGLIPHRQVTILAGDGGVGKSLLALQFGAAAALGIETTGLSPQQGRVLYLGAEDEEDEFHRRLADIVRAHSRQLSDLHDFRLVPMADSDALLAVPDKNGVMQPTAVWTQLCDLARDFRPCLVVLDTVADLFGGDEIKRGQARQFIGMLRRLAIEINCSIVLLAHPSQEGIRSGSGSSGSTGWKNSSRSMLYFSRPEGDREADPDQRLLSTKKINYGKVGGEIQLRWEDGCFVAEESGSSPGVSLTNRKAEQTFVELLRTFTRTGQNVGASPGTNYAPAKMSKHPGSNGLSKRNLEGAMQRLLEDGTIKLVWEGPPSKPRQRLMVSADDYGAKKLG